VKLLIQELIRGESGQDLIEYALLVSFLALVSVAALNILGTTLAGFYQGLQTRLSQM
jgi:Flp pilus assembly pilin Flp